MSPLEAAIFKRMEEIVQVEKRAFSGADLRRFEYDGETYKAAAGTVRNIVSKLKKEGKIIYQFPINYAYYSLPGHDFTRQMTLDRAGVLPLVGRQTPLYKWLKGRPRGKQSLHDIRLTLVAKEIWNTLSKKFPEKIDASNQDLHLDSLKFSDDIIVKVIVHHSDTVSVPIACPYRPLVIDIPDILYLIEILTRVETKLAGLCGESVIIPRYTTWIAKMWHFGFDFLDRYDGEKFHVTFEEGISDLWRIYTKRMKDGKYKVRVEHQECLNKPVIDAVMDKLYQDGEIT